MKIIATLYDSKHLEAILNVSDGIILGNDKVGTRLTHSFSLEEICQMIEITKNLKKEVFIQANQMFNDVQLDFFKTWISSLPLNTIDGVVVGDLGAFRVLSKLGYAEKAIYNPETLMTNIYDFNFLKDAGIKGVYVAKEITLEDIQMIASKKSYQLFMVGHGHLNMFYSKRQLIHNFMDYQDKPHTFHNQQNLKIIEETRDHEAYPILEDDAGTHVFRSHVFASLDHLDTLKHIVDYMIIDTLFKDDQYALQVLPMYKNETKDEHAISSIQASYDETWDDGFFYKKTIYKAKDSL